MHMHKIVFLMVMVGILNCFFPGYAQSAPSYAVQPLVLDVDAEGRDIIERVVTVTNTGTVPVTLYPTVNNISMTAGGVIEAFLPPSMSEQSTSLSSWIEISRAGIDLQPGAKKDIPLTPYPTPGTYHAFVGFGHGRNRDEAEMLVHRGDAPGSVVTVNIADTAVTLLKLSRFVVDRFITGTGNEAAVYTVVNPGDEPIVPQGEVILYNSNGNEVAALPINTEGTTIEPGAQKEFMLTIPSEGMLGKYKAYLSIAYGENGLATVQDTSFFYVFPYRIVLPLFGAVLVTVILIAFFVHRRYFDDATDDGSEEVALHVRDGVSDALHHDINLRNRP
jgi:hypothetical protein